MAMAAPVDRLKLVVNYPVAKATDTEILLSEIAAGKPVVLHLFTA